MPNWSLAESWLLSFILGLLSSLLPTSVLIIGKNQRVHQRHFRIREGTYLDEAIPEFSVQSKIAAGLAVNSRRFLTPRL